MLTEFLTIIAAGSISIAIMFGMILFEILTHKSKNNHKK